MEVSIEVFDLLRRARIDIRQARNPIESCKLYDFRVFSVSECLVYLIAVPLNHYFSGKYLSSLPLMKHSV